MDNKIHLEVITPDRALVKDDVDSAVIPGARGEFQVYRGHTPFLTDLAIGRVSYVKEGNRTYVSISGGFCEVMPDRVLVLARTAETPAMIDKDRAQASRDRAMERIASKSETKIDEERARFALLRALNRLETSEMV